MIKIARSLRERTCVNMILPLVFRAESQIGWLHVLLILKKEPTRTQNKGLDQIMELYRKGPEDHPNL